MAIEYIEILDTTKTPIGIIDTAKSIIWHNVYFGCGDFEIYCQAEKYSSLLQIGNYVTRNGTNDVGIIESINVTFTLQDGYMIVASGRFAKSILDRRLIYKLSGNTNTPTILSGKVEVAARRLVLDNAINCTFDTRRNIPNFALGALKNFAPIIVDENGNPAQKQVSYQNLLEYTDELLHEYGYGAKVTINDSNKNFLYTVFTGTDRSKDNTGGFDPVIFSIEYDNLNSSNYLYNEKPLKNAALIGGEGEGLERFYSLLTGGKTGLQLREIFVDASSINQTYKDENDQEQTYTTAEYISLLNQQGRQALLKQIIEQKFNGDINVKFGVWQLDRDYFIGDTITIQDNLLGIYINTRITETTEVQDEKGYSVDVVFGQ
jgi:hypothetical protein